jgi:tetratricopeptide (TPR) repeat protein
MENSSLGRAYMLLEQNRYQEALDIMENLFPDHAKDPEFLGLFSEVNLLLKNNRKAREHIDSAIGISPDNDYLFFIKARVEFELENYDISEESIGEAISLNPNQSEYFSFWASIKLFRKKYNEALGLADNALALNPEDINGLNVRSSALLKLKRHSDSFQTIETALKEDPNNAYTHTNFGFNLLEKGDSKQALYHFREALRINPNLEQAQLGMATALKARYVIYKWFLNYSFWISNLAKKNQWIFIIGVYIGFRLIRFVAKQNQALQPFLTPLIFILTIIAFSTWVINPISNLFLRLNPFGKHLLTSKEIQSSNYVGLSLFIFLIGLVAYLINREDKWIAVAAFGFAMMVPLSSVFSETKNNKVLYIYTIAMALIGTVAVINAFTSDQIFSIYSSIFLLGFIAYQWIANYMVIEKNNA